MDKLDDINEKIIKDYKKNIGIIDVKFFRDKCWDYLTVKIIDDNKRFFKYKTLSMEFLYETEKGLEPYIKRLIILYTKKETERKIRKLQTEFIMEEYKKETEKSE